MLVRICYPDRYPGGFTTLTPNKKNPGGRAPGLADQGFRGGFQIFIFSTAATACS